MHVERSPGRSSAPRLPRRAVRGADRAGDPSAAGAGRGPGAGVARRRVPALAANGRLGARAADGGVVGAVSGGPHAAVRPGSGELMPIVVRIEVELAKRKMSVGE